MTPSEVQKDIVDALVRRVVDDATGTSVPPFQRYSGPPPDSEFWLGTLTPEARLSDSRRSRASIERFTPASQGFRFRVPPGLTSALPGGLVRWSAWEQ